MKDLLGYTLCNLCGRRADGPMLPMGEDVTVHAACVELRLARLLDPNWEPGKPDPALRYCTCPIKEPVDNG